MGETFEEFDDAQGNVGPAASKRDDWTPSKWGGERSPECLICQEPLHRKSGNGDTKEIEALFENPDCSHAFHRECLEKWIQGAILNLPPGRLVRDRNLRCPSCSRPIAQSVLDTVFDARANVQEVDSDDGFEEEGREQREAGAEDS